MLLSSVELKIFSLILHLQSSYYIRVIAGVQLNILVGIRLMALMKDRFYWASLRRYYSYYLLCHSYQLKSMKQIIVSNHPLVVLHTFHTIIAQTLFLDCLKLLEGIIFIGSCGQIIIYGHFVPGSEITYNLNTMLLWIVTLRCRSDFYIMD